MKTGRWAGILLILSLLFVLPASADTINLWAESAGDGTRERAYNYWQPYETDSEILEVFYYKQSGVSADYQHIFIEIPIEPLSGTVVTQAALVLESLGFSGPSASSVYHILPASGQPTGDIAADNLVSWTEEQGASWLIYDDGSGPAKNAGLFELDVTAAVLDDLAAGRAYSTFKITIEPFEGTGTTRSITASESTEGTGPHLSVNFSGAAVPVPGAAWLLGTGLLGLIGIRRKR